MTNHFSRFSKNGEILPLKDATVSLQNIEYSYGFGVYETLKVRNGVLFFLIQHIERLFKSAEIIELVHPFTKERVASYIQDLVSALGITSETVHNSCNLKILLIGGKEPLLFILPMNPLFPDRKLYSLGAKTITVHYERLFPNAKTLNMLGSYLAYSKAKKQDCYEALMIDHENNIIEGTRTNFFALKGSTIVSPPKEKILEGVTKQTMLAVAKKNGYTFEESDISYDGLMQYDGFFLTSTSSKIIPIHSIDDIIFEKVPLKLQHVMKLYDNFLDESKGVFEGTLK